MVEVLDFIVKYKEAMPLLGAATAAALGGLWVLIQYVLAQRREHSKQVFESYHKLIEELVDGGPNGPFVDRQCAIIYELRFFRRYRPVTRRILAGLKTSWMTKPNYTPRLGDEIDLTIKKAKGYFWVRS